MSEQSHNLLTRKIQDNGESPFLKSVIYIRGIRDASPTKWNGYSNVVKRSTQFLVLISVRTCTLGARSNLAASSLDSSSVARCTSVSAVSHTISLTGSFGSMRSRCCRTLRNGISWGVSATWTMPL